MLLQSKVNRLFTSQISSGFWNILLHYTKWRTTQAFFQFGWSRAVLDKKHHLKSIRINTRRFIGTWLDGCCPGVHPPPVLARVHDRWAKAGLSSDCLRHSPGQDGYPVLSVSSSQSCKQAFVCWFGCFDAPLYTLCWQTENTGFPLICTRLCKHTRNHDDISYLKWCSLFYKYGLSRSLGLSNE